MMSKNNVGSSPENIKAIIAFVIFALALAGVIIYGLSVKTGAQNPEETQEPNNEILNTPYQKTPPESVYMDFNNADFLGHWREIYSKTGSENNWEIKIDELPSGMEGYILGNGGTNSVSCISYYRHFCDFRNTVISGEIQIPDGSLPSVAVELATADKVVGFSMNRQMLSVYQFGINGTKIELPKPYKKIEWECEPVRWHKFKLTFKDGKVLLDINGKQLDELAIETSATGKSTLQLKVVKGFASFDNIRIDFK